MIKEGELRLSKGRYSCEERDRQSLASKQLSSLLCKIINMSKMEPDLIESLQPTKFREKKTSIYKIR